MGGAYRLDRQGDTLGNRVNPLTPTVAKWVQL